MRPSETLETHSSCAAARAGASAASMTVVWLAVNLPPLRWPDGLLLAMNFCYSPLSIPRLFPNRPWPWYNLFACGTSQETIV